MLLDLSADFQKPAGTYTVELPGVTPDAHDSLREMFIPLIADDDMKARDAIRQGFEFALRTCPDQNPSDLWHHVIYRLYLGNKVGQHPGHSWVKNSGDAVEHGS